MKVLKAACIPWITSDPVTRGKPGWPFLPCPVFEESPPLVVASGQEAMVERVENGEDADEESNGNILIKFATRPLVASPHVGHAP